MAGLNVSGPVENAKALLRRHGHRCEVSPEELERWFQADTPYPDIGLAEVLQRPLLVVHELVEIDAVKRRGLPLTKSVILQNLELVDEAHLQAAEVELELAAATEDFEHLEDRLKDFRKWCEDPLTTPRLRGKYQELHTRAQRALGDFGKAGRKSR